VIEPEGQIPRPLRLAGRILEMNPAWHGLPALLVAHADFHRAARDESGANQKQASANSESVHDCCHLWSHLSCYDAPWKPTSMKLSALGNLPATQSEIITI
jgi:hypothetical protein